MNGVRKTVLEAALDLLPIQGKKNDIGERDRLIWAKETKPTRAHVPDLRGPTRHGPTRLGPEDATPHVTVNLTGIAVRSLCESFRQEVGQN